jgi:2-polyprenyl-6-methoxyphenol hydroxylase-like FAD-dependent oxidoreductase
VTAKRPILIAGGGPVGVIAALALARQGLEVRVFEAMDDRTPYDRVVATQFSHLWK